MRDTVSNIRISKDVIVTSFPHFNGTGSVYTFVSVNRWNNEAGAHTGMENSPQNIRGYTNILECSSNGCAVGVCADRRCDS